MLPFSAGKTIWDELPETNIDVQKLEHLFESRAKDLISKVRTCNCMPLYVLRFWESTFLHQFTVSIFSNSIFLYFDLSAHYLSTILWILSCN